MTRFKNFVKKMISTPLLILSEVAWILIDFMILMSFVWLTVSSFQAFQGKNLTREIILTYVSGVAICLSLASVLFSYARVCDGDEKQKSVRSGKAILNGGILLLISFMLNYYQIHATVNSLSVLQPLFNYTRLFALVGGVCFAFIAAIELHRGFKSLVGQIFY
jgi:hypothetical protein